MDWPTLAMGGAAAGLAVFVVGGYRVSARTGLLGRSLLANVGLSKPERAAQRDRFWAEVFGPNGGLDRWLIFGGVASVLGSVLAFGALAG